MSNFFNDYASNPEQSKIIKKSFEGLFDILQLQAQEISRNHNISRVLTYRRIQFQKIDMSDAIYSLTDLLNDASIMSVVGIEHNKPFNQKLELWNKMSPMEKANLLDIANYSIMLTSFSHLLSEDEFMARKFNVIDFELTDLSNNKYIKNVDYVFYDNKLFLLRQFNSDDIYRQKYLILKDIVIDMNTTEGILGERLNIPYNYEFTKTDYTETLKGFVEAAAGGPTLDNLTKALGRYKALDEVKIYDKYSANKVMSTFWGSNGYMGTLSNFDFIISMPIKFVYKPEKLEYIRKFFTQIKPSYSNFIFTPELDTKDELPLKFKDDILKIEGTRRPFVDYMKKDDYTYSLNIHKTSDYMNKSDNHWYTPTSYIKDYYDPRHTDSHLKFTTANLNDLITYNQDFEYDVKYDIKEKVHVRRWVQDGYYLDKDYFDVNYLTDPFGAIAKIPFIDILKGDDKQLIDISADLKDLIKDKVDIFKEGNLDLGIENIEAKDLPWNTAQTNKIEYINYDDNTITFPILSPTNNIVYDEKINNIGVMTFKEKKVYFPWNEKHDLFNMDDEMYFDPMQMKSIVNPIIEPNLYSKLNARDSVVINNQNIKLHDYIYNSDFQKVLLKINFNEKTKINNNQNENLYISDNDDFLDSVVFQDDCSNIPSTKIKESIGCKETVGSLNSKILYDKIKPINDITKISLTDKKDNINFCNKANIIKCDSIFNCDYEEFNNMRLDNAPEGYIDNGLSESIELVLIPKTKK